MGVGEWQVIGSPYARVPLATLLCLRMHLERREELCISAAAPSGCTLSYRETVSDSTSGRA